MAFCIRPIHRLNSIVHEFRTQLADTHSLTSIQKNNMKKLFYTLILFASLKASGQSFSTTDIQKLKWLEGSWKGMANDKPFYEAWRFFNDSVLVNFAIEIQNGDTIIKESSALILSGGQVSLGQPPTQWKASRITQNEIVLKNDTLKFSNVIIWLHTKEDHWFTVLEHPRSTVYYDMVRDAALNRKVDAWLADKKKGK